MPVLELNQSNRLLVSRLFANHQRVNLIIPSIIEGQHGYVHVDFPIKPTVFQIQQGPFVIFSGDAKSDKAANMIKHLFPGSNILPSPLDWINLLQQIHGEKIEKYTRYYFSSKNLDLTKIENLQKTYSSKFKINRINEPLANKIANDPKHNFHFFNYSSIYDFLQRGIGYCAIENDTIIGVASSAIVCSLGIEVNIMVIEEYRKIGIATALASNLLKYCLENGIDPHWDAQNEISCALAKKLGYNQETAYDTFFYKR